MPKYESKWEEDRWLYAVGALFGIGFVAYCFLFLTKNKTDIQARDLVQVEKLVLKEAPEYEKVKSNESITLQTTAYEKPFIISNESINASIQYEVLQLKAGDTISVGMTRKEYANIRNDNFFDRKTNINSLQKDGREYLDLSFRNQNTYEGTWKAVPAAIFATLACLIIAARRERPPFNPALAIGIGILVITIITSRYF